MSWLIGGVCAVFVALVSHRLRFLTRDGAIAAALMGWIIFSAGGVAFSVPILLFFATSSLLSRLNLSRKSQLPNFQVKESQRTSRQVFANGLAPTVLLLAWYAQPASLWAQLYLVSLAAAAADTWATEIGVLSQSAPRSIVSWKPVLAGTSGGVSMSGMLAALLGSSVLVLLGLLVFDLYGILPFLWRDAGLLVLVGFLAQVVDSLLGATLQAKFECPRCGQSTERRSHCNDDKTRLVSGWPWLDNDAVNLTSVVIGVLVATASLLGV